MGDLVVTTATHFDINNIVKAHLSAFKGFFLPDLGRGFLRKYYTYVLNYKFGILLVGIYKNTLVGFVAGFINPANFYKELRRKKLSLAISILPAIIRKPDRIRRLLVNFKRTKSLSEDTAKNKTVAELSSIGVNPGEKKGIGTQLINAFIRRAEELGASSVRLTTDTYGNDAVNIFYKKHGFVLLRTFEAQPGRWLNEYEKLI